MTRSRPVIWISPASVGPLSRHAGNSWWKEPRGYPDRFRSSDLSPSARRDPGSSAYLARLLARVPTCTDRFDSLATTTNSPWSPTPYGVSQYLHRSKTEAWSLRGGHSRAGRHDETAFRRTSLVFLFYFARAHCQVSRDLAITPTSFIRYVMGANHDTTHSSQSSSFRSQL